jgi:hypothetical protein
MNSPVPPPLRGFSKNRIEALIDGIFAVALTLLVLDIKLPENLFYATNGELWTRLKSLERHVIYVNGPRVALYVYLLLAGAHFMPGWIDEHVIAPPPVAADPILDSDPNDSRTGQ